MASRQSSLVRRKRRRKFRPISKNYVSLDGSVFLMLRPFHAAAARTDLYCRTHQHQPFERRKRLSMKRGHLLRNLLGNSQVDVVMLYRYTLCYRMKQFLCSRKVARIWGLTGITADFTYGRAEYWFRRARQIYMFRSVADV